jgi:hypothetical protein
VEEKWDAGSALESLSAAAEPAALDGDYEPVYGLPRLAVEESLAHNPQLREEYELRGWLARNPPAWHEFETGRRERSTILRRS